MYNDITLSLRNKNPFEQLHRTDELFWRLSQLVAEPIVEEAYLSLQATTEGALGLGDYSITFMNLVDEAYVVIRSSPGPAPTASMASMSIALENYISMLRQCRDAVTSIVERTSAPDFKPFYVSGSPDVQVIGHFYECAHEAMYQMPKVICEVWDLMCSLADGEVESEHKLTLAVYLMGEAMRQQSTTDPLLLVRQVRREHQFARQQRKAQPLSAAPRAQNVADSSCTV
jgi:hypothetical protein